MRDSVNPHPRKSHVLQRPCQDVQVFLEWKGIDEAVGNLRDCFDSRDALEGLKGRVRRRYVVRQKLLAQVRKTADRRHEYVEVLEDRFAAGAVGVRGRVIQAEFRPPRADDVGHKTTGEIP